MELQRMITVKGCGWTKAAIQARLLKSAAVPAVLDAKGNVTTPAVEAQYHESVPLIKVAGIVHKVKPGTTTIGDKVSEWLKLQGDFTAVNLSTGEMFRAPSCILSDIVSGPIAEALKNGGDEAQFAVEIGAKYNATAATLYEFSTKPLMEIKQTDKMTQLLALSGIATETQALAAPAGDNADSGTGDDAAGDPAPAEVKPGGKGKK